MSLLIKATWLKLSPSTLWIAYIYYSISAQTSVRTNLRDNWTSGIEQIHHSDMNFQLSAYVHDQFGQKPPSSDSIFFSD
jgi:hypothetical protein